MTSPRSAETFASTSSDLREMLRRGLDQLRLHLTDEMQWKLLRFAELLAKWNRVYNLTAVRDPRDMLAVHLLDSLSLLPLIDRFAPASIVDVGSGAGLPGIPIALARSAITVVTVDAVAKKISFQRQCKADLEIANLTPIHGRVEALTLDKTADLVVARAFASLVSLLTSTSHLAADDAVVLAMKGATPFDELEAVPEPWTVTSIEPLDVPFLGAQRCAVVLTRRR